MLDLHYRLDKKTCLIVIKPMKVQQTKGFELSEDR